MSVRIHKVQPGETLVSIAAHYNFRSWETIADLEENAALFELRGHGHAVQAGDELAIPEPSVGAAELLPGQEHEFKVAVSPKKIVIRVYTEFRRLKEDDEKPDETTDDTKPGRKADTIRGWSRGTGHPLPVVDATITLTSMAGATRTGKTDRRGRLWVEKLDDDGWFLDLTPTADELSPGIALPTKDIDHGTDWTSGSAPGQRSITREAKLKTKRRFDIEYRPFQLFITVENGAIITVGVSNPKKAKGRPHHAMAFWLDVERDDHDKKNGNERVEQVLEIDLKPDFLRKVYKKDKGFAKDFQIRPIAQVREQDIDLFQIHHTAGSLITGAINDMINLSVKRKSGKKKVQFKGVHFINDRDGHVVRLVDDHYQTQHGGGSGKLRPAWDGRTSINDRAIGVENVQGKNKNKAVVPWTDAQIASLKTLVRSAKDVYSIQNTHVIGHGDVLRGKARACPGGEFPWEELEDEDLALKPVVPTDAAGLGELRNAAFGGFFAIAGRVLKEGDVDINVDGKHGLKRGKKVIASDLSAGPVASLHRYFKRIGYIPSRTESGKPFDDNKDEDKVFYSALAEAITLFHGRHQRRLPENKKRDNVDQTSGDVIASCYVAAVFDAVL